jgi:hypothetical protein
MAIIEVLVGPPAYLVQKTQRDLAFLKFGAQEKTRTSTALRPQVPETCASTSSATWALNGLPYSIDLVNVNRVKFC